MKLFIKNMVSIRCKIVVKSLLDDLGLDYVSVELGEVVMNEPLSEQEIDLFKVALRSYGFDLLENKKSVLVEKIRHIIVEVIHYSDEPLNITFSSYLSEKLNYDYHYLSSLFSEVKGTTIEQFIITHKIERVKELLVYDEFTLTEIAYKLNYSSVGHLSRQFKKVTGLTPSFFKEMRSKRSRPLEDL